MRTIRNEIYVYEATGWKIDPPPPPLPLTEQTAIEIETEPTDG